MSDAITPQLPQLQVKISVSGGATPVDATLTKPGEAADAKAVGDALKEIAKGGDSENGATFTPAVDADGNLSWSNDKGLENPDPVNIKGPKGDAGERGINWRGEWSANAGSIFNSRDAVHHNGSAWICIADRTPDGIEPGTDDTTWALLASKGLNGRTPVKCVDYYTNAEKEALVNEVLNRLPAAEGVDF